MKYTAKLPIPSAKDWGRGKVTHCQLCGWTGKTGCDQGANIAPVQQHLFWPVGWKVTLGCFCSELTPLIYTQRLCYHQHLQVVAGGQPSAPLGGHEEAKTAVVGCKEKCLKWGRFSRTDPPVNKRAGDFAGEAFSDMDCVEWWEENIMKSKHCPQTGLMVK